MQQVFNQGLQKRTALQDSMGRQVQDRINGINPVLQNQFAQQDQATATGNAQARQDAVQPGMFGQGRATRGAQMAQQGNLERISGNKINQAGLSAKDVQDATTQGMGYQNNLTAEDQNNRDFAYKAAGDLGDSVSMGGLARLSQQKQGAELTGYGETAMTNQAKQQAADAARERQRADEEYAYTQAMRKKAAKGASQPWISSTLSGLGGLASLVPGYGTAIGTGLTGVGAIAKGFGK